MTKFEIEEKIVSMLKTVFDPEIPVNVYDLGLIYKIDVSDQGEASIDMTLTAPNCPAADCHHGRCAPEGGIHRRRNLRHHQSRFRTRVGQGHDERRSETGTGIPLNQLKVQS